MSLCLYVDNDGVNYNNQLSNPRHNWAQIWSAVWENIARTALDASNWAKIGYT